MRKPKERIKIESKKVSLAQYGGTEDSTVTGEYETIENQHSKYAKAIGSFIISFSELEESLDNDLATAINERAHEAGYRIIKYLGFRNKVDLLNDDYFRYIEYLDSASAKLRLSAELRVIYNKLCELSEFRNRVAHANWLSLDSSGFVRTRIIEAKDGSGVQLEKVKMTPSVLIKFRKQNEALSRKIDFFREKVWAARNRDDRRRYKRIEALNKNKGAREASLK